MTDGLHSADSPDDSARGGARTGTPRWVKVGAGIAIAVVLLLGGLMLLGGGGHSLGRHLGDDSPARGPGAPSSAPRDGPPGRDGGEHAPPAGGHP